MSANLDPNHNVSNYDKFIAYVSKGAEIGQQTLAAEKRDSRMRELVKAPNTGEVSVVGKAVNFVYLGLIALPALASYKFTESVFKYFANRTHDKAMGAKGELLRDINVLFKNQLNLEAQIVVCKRDIDLTTQKIIEFPQIPALREKLAQLESKLTSLKENLKDVKAKTDEKYNKLELEDNKLHTSTLLRAKEHLFAQRNAIEGALINGHIGEGENRVFIPKGNNDLRAAFENLHTKLTDGYIKSHDNAIRDYETVLQLMSGGVSTLGSVREDPLLAATDGLSVDQIKHLIAQHKIAKAEMLEIDGVVKGPPNIIEKIKEEILVLNAAKQYEEALVIGYEQHLDQAINDVTMTLGQPENDSFLEIQTNIEKDIERSQAKITGLVDQITAKTAELNEAIEQSKNIDRPAQVLLTPKEKIDGLMKKINNTNIQIGQLQNVPTRGESEIAEVDVTFKKLSAELEQAEIDLNQELSKEIEVTTDQLSKTKAALLENVDERKRNLLAGWKGKDMGAHLTAGANLERKVTHLTKELKDYKFVQAQLWIPHPDFDPEFLARSTQNRINEENRVVAERAQKEIEETKDREEEIMENYHSQVEIENENASRGLLNEQRIETLTTNIAQLQGKISTYQTRIDELRSLHNKAETPVELKVQYVRQRQGLERVQTDLKNKLAAQEKELKSLQG